MGVSTLAGSAFAIALPALGDSCGAIRVYPIAPYAGLYTIRSSQLAHAQCEQNNVSVCDVVMSLKLKLLQIWSCTLITARLQKECVKVSKSQDIYLEPCCGIKL